MKNNRHIKKGSLKHRLASAGILACFLLGVITLHAQVNFYQTLNADFYKGVYNNVLVSGDNVYLPLAASGVGSSVAATALPQNLSGHRMVSWNDRYVYLVGGHNGSNYVDNVYRATINAGGGMTAWTAQNALPVALRDPAVVIGTNTIYVMGGRDATQVYATIWYAVINADGSLGTWQTSAVSLPAARWGHTATYIMGHIYVAGGSGSLSENTAQNTVYYTKVMALNTLGAFTNGTNLLTACNRHTAVTYNRKLYIIGGYDNSGTKANTVYSVTPALNGSIGAWTPEPTLPVAVSNHASVVVNGMISVMAGAVGATLSNKIYYALADAGTLTWTESTNLMYDFTKDGAAFSGNGQMCYGGGVNLSSTPVNTSRYYPLTLTTNYINNGVFVSNPFYELGMERVITSLTFVKNYTAPANLQVTYRVAGSDGMWGDWTTAVATSPIAVGLTKQYLQYAVYLTGSGTLNSTLNEMMLTTPGTQLSGNLNAMTSFTSAGNPYWATADISFTSGTHTFGPGTIVMFSPETGLTVGAASVQCNGVAGDSVYFKYYTTGTGNWDGIYFNENSDNSVSSQLNYTVIENAGFGSNNANLYCYQTTEPLLSRCAIRGADGNGVRLNASNISIQNTSLRANLENGLELTGSNPTLISTAISYNGQAGVNYNGASSVPNFATTTIDHNLYGFHYPTPNMNIVQPAGSPILTSNTYNGVAVDGGDITVDVQWNFLPYDYIILGTVRMGEYGGCAILTLKPGITIKCMTGVQLQCGFPTVYGGGIYAVGKSDSLITFTAANGLSGGWGGIYFSDYSDNWGPCQSQFDYCVIEKGNDYNYYSVSTSHPNVMNNSTIRLAAQDGARYASASGNITNCQFVSNGRYPLYLMNPEANPVHTTNTYTGNTINRIALSGGDYTFNRTYNNDGVPYYVLDNIAMVEYGGKARITFDPGVIVDFAAGKKLQLGRASSYGGEIYAVGTSSDPIEFRAYSGIDGDWEGIHFTQWNDDWAGSSTFEYCTVKNGNSQNILIEGSVNQPVITNCTIRNSLNHGIVVTASSPKIRNSTFTNNAGYPLKFTDWTCNAYLRTNSYPSNGINYIALSGGDYDASRSILFDNIPYHVLGNINMVGWGAHPRLTVQPGVILAFNPGIKLQFGTASSYGGEILAEGKADSLITFKPYNNTAGGWDGIYFTEWNDNWSGVSSMKYCVVEKGNGYNIQCIGSGQPTLDHCILTQSTGSGLIINSSTLTIKNSNFTNNSTHGIYLDGNGTATLGNTDLLTCNLYNNGTDELYNNSSADVNARYNYWGTGDSTMVATRIYDEAENSAKGKVNFVPFAQVPSLFTTNTLMSGTVKYANLAASPIKNATLAIKTFAAVPVASTLTNPTTGAYSFASFPSGNYQMTLIPSNPSGTWSPCNATDALAILRHFTKDSLLTSISSAAADVNLSRTINATDAMFVMKRYTNLITSFPAGDATWHTNQLIVNGSNVTNNMLMIYYGDVNATFVPAKKSSSSVGLVHEGSLVVESFSEFLLPVRLKTAMQVGAISLGLYYPVDYLEVVDATLANGTGGFAWSAMDGLFRMGWCDLNALQVNNDEVVVLLKMRSKDLSPLTAGILLEIFNDSEFADGSARPNEWAVVSVPVINTKSTGMATGQDLTEFSVFPNPVTDRTMVRFTLATTCTVKCYLMDISGTIVREVSDAKYLPGTYEIPLRDAGLKPGLYFLTTTLSGGTESVTGTIKLVVTH